MINMFELPGLLPHIFSKDDFLYIINNYNNLYERYITKSSKVNKT